MFWDKAAFFYDYFEYIYNREVNRLIVFHVVSEIKETDVVLECACGTGMFSKGLALKSKRLIATDYSDGMLKRTKRNLRGYWNASVRRADICHLCCRDERFDKVVAGNVIHLLDSPSEAITELLRVTKPGGKVLIPTYVNDENSKTPGWLIRFLEKSGANFKRQFTYETYQEFFRSLGFEYVKYSIVRGKMPCAIAVLTKKENS